MSVWIDFIVIIAPHLNYNLEKNIRVVAAMCKWKTSNVKYILDFLQTPTFCLKVFGINALCLPVCKTYSIHSRMRSKHFDVEHCKCFFYQTIVDKMSYCKFSVGYPICHPKQGISHKIRTEICFALNCSGNTNSYSRNYESRWCTFFICQAQCGTHSQISTAAVEVWKGIYQ